MAKIGSFKKVSGEYRGHIVTLASVIVGGERLLHVENLTHVSQVLEMVDAMEADGIDPCDASPDHWRDVAARLNGGRQIRPYTRARHAAWLQRSRTGR